MPKRSRRGRKRLQDVQREPNGRPERSYAEGERKAAHTRQQELKERQERANQVAAIRAREMGVTVEQALAPDSAEPLGALHVRGAISDDQRNAGEIYAAMYARAARADGLPSVHAKTGSMADYVSRGSVPARHQPIDVKDDRRAKRRLEEIDARLKERNVLHLIRVCVVEQQYPLNLTGLRTALDIVAKEVLHLAPDAKSGRNDVDLRIAS